MRAYAGIGSRSTPDDVLALMQRCACELAARGYTLRSGHATGADQAFERGAGTRAEVYLPWAKFEGDVAVDAVFVSRHPSDAAHELASEHHPAWERLGRGPRALHARNCHQILGRDLDDPVAFVLCWTPDGATDRPNQNTGGTGQALRIAASRSIPVFNLARADHLARVQQFLPTPATTA